MGKERASNLELLRIILMCMVPLYHLMIYNGIVFVPYYDKTPLGLFLVSGSAITADYAFMALSAHFLLEARNKPVISKFLTVGMQVATMYLVKMVTLRILLGYQGDNPYIEDFLIHGAWWFAYGYLILLLVYPLLNGWIFTAKLKYVKISCVILGILFLIHGAFNQVNFINDLLAFGFTYLMLGCMKRQDYQQLLMIRNTRRNMLLLYLSLFLGTFVAGWLVKYPGHLPSDVIASEIVRRLVGKYSMIQFVMGLALFLLFRSIQIPQSKVINRISKAGFTVFLLHETIMGIWWYWGLADYRMRDYSLGAFLGCSVLYLISCYGVAMIVQEIYDRTLAKWGRLLIGKIAKIPWVQNMERRYIEVQQWGK